MGKYRKKPVVIEAVRVVPADERPKLQASEKPLWLTEAINAGKVRWWRLGECYHIDTLEGTMTANVGDWIIRGVKGELYPCKPDIFEATYERVDDAA